MPQYAFLAVEGPHDAEFVAKLLKLRGLRRVRKVDELDDFWKVLVPSTYPHEGDLLKRMPVPLFLSSKTHSVAIRSASGVTELVNATEQSMATLNTDQLGGVGLVLDADSDEVPTDRLAKLRMEWEVRLKLPFPTKPGAVAEGKTDQPRVGVTILPDNHSPGTLENILVDCAGKSYPQLLEGAGQFVDSVDSRSLDNDEGKELCKPAGRNKAVCGCIANVLKPGRSIQVSIQDNNWVTEDTAALESVRVVDAFLAEVVGLS